jgi:hypothetical protein
MPSIPDNPLPNLFGGLASGAGATGSAISDLFAASADQSKAQGDLAEAQQYGLAAQYADQEAQYTKVSTAIQGFQAERELSQSLGQTTADVAGAGFASSGSALDLLRSSASQGAIQQATIQQQGLITEQGYLEQAKSYDIMEGAAEQAASAEKTASFGADLAAGVQGLTAGLKFAQAFALV